MGKLNINKKAVGNFFGTLGKGILKEAVSYVPVIGDNLSNSIEKHVGKKIGANEGNDQVVEIVGKVIIGGLVVAFIFGYLTMDDLKSISKLID